MRKTLDDLNNSEVTAVSVLAVVNLLHEKGIISEEEYKKEIDSIINADKE